MDTTVAVHNLSVHKGSSTILEHVSFTVQRGHIIGLLGPSGAGKTTLMRVLVGRQKATHGHVRILGKAPGSHALRKEIGYVTQAPSIYTDLTVRENLRYFAALTGARQSRIDEVIEQLNLQKQAHQLGETLSGGQKARVSLAVALLAKPPLLVLDEPTVGIDPILRHELWEQFHTLAKAGTTLLVSSHVMDEAAHCDSLLLIHNGRLLDHGSEKQLMSRSHAATLEDAFIALIKGDSA